MAACAPAAPDPAEPAGPPRDGGRTVSVLYAGSLVGLQEKVIGPAFQRATGLGYRGEGNGSVAAALAIRDGLRTPDVFISADPAVNETELMGPANGALVDWYLTFATTRLVIAYNLRGRFAAELERARAGDTPWHEPLSRPGFRFGRTDPHLDPKGYRTLIMADLAEAYYSLQGLRARLMGEATNPAQLFFEPQLLIALEAGQLDAIAAYALETADRGLPWIELPPEINLGDPAHADRYQTAAFTQRNGTVRRGSPVVFTITIPRAAPNPDAAQAFVRFLLSPEGRALHRGRGLEPSPILAGGNRAAVPPRLSDLVEGHYSPPHPPAPSPRTWRGGGEAEGEAP
ncbi:MAG: extracellular solute-binding protein [Chloroflexi bacterium]|nr:extracellular solute-binding protein [Chloroflexota bacterium]